MSTVYINNEILNDIANAIREKTGKTSKMYPKNFATNILNIGPSVSTTPNKTTVTKQVVKLDDGILTNVASAIRTKLNNTKKYYPQNMAAAIRSIPFVDQDIDTIWTTGSPNNIEWWDNLRGWMRGKTTEQLSQVKGWIHTVDLKYPVLGMTRCTFIVTGVNEVKDRDDSYANTLTFTSRYVTPESTYFHCKGDGDTALTYWVSTNLVKDYCNDFVFAFPAKEAICPTMDWPIDGVKGRVPTSEAIREQYYDHLNSNGVTVAGCPEIRYQFNVMPGDDTKSMTFINNGYWFVGPSISPGFVLRVSGKSDGYKVKRVDPTSEQWGIKFMWGISDNDKNLPPYPAGPIHEGGTPDYIFP